MQHDDLIWSVIKRNHCSFRLSSSAVQKFCQNVYNNTGLCNHNSCPLANSQYATIREVDGKLFLYMKVVERAAFPNRLWERVQLSNNYLRSLQLISRHLAFWQPNMVFKVKQRFTRMKQYMVRKKRLMKKEPEVHLSLMHKKHHKRELKLEYKALRAAKLEQTVEGELKERLRSGVYSDIYNFDTHIFNRLTDKEKEKTHEQQIELESGDEEEFNYEEETESLAETSEPVKELVESDFEGDSDTEQRDIEDMSSPSISSKSTKTKPTAKSFLKRKSSAVAKRKHKKVEFEYETEEAPVRKQKVQSLKLNF